MRISIIGAGRFGTLLQKHLSTDNTIQIDNPRECDLVIFSVPNRSLAQAIEQWKPHIPSRAIVMDVGSVKTIPCQLLQKHFSKNVLGTHPLYGPDSAKESWQGHKVVLCRLQIDDYAYNQVKQLFTSRGVTVYECTPEEHDTMMAKTQALVHFIGRALQEIEPHEISTPDYEKLLAMMDRVKHDTYELFYDMQNLNPFAAVVRNDFARRVLQLQFDITQHTAAPLELAELRAQIDEIDESIVALVGQRFALVKQIGERKKADQMQVLDSKRETELFLRLNTLAQRYNVPIQVVTHVYDFLMTESKRQQA